MKKLLSLVTALFVVALAHAQISHGGFPKVRSWKGALEPVSFEQMPAFNLDSLRAEDAILDHHKDIPYRFGFNHTVHLNPMNSGVVSYNSRGDMLWRVGVASEGALSLNVLMDGFLLPPGATLFVYAPDQSQIGGAFTHENNKEWGTLALDMLATDSLIIEYYEPYNAPFTGSIQVGRVTHGYRSPLRDFGDSGSCNNNVNCPEGAPWQTEKRSVLLILVNGFASCTGALINNTAQDGTPYFLTADHCLGGNVNNWVFRFNYESPNCANVNGPTNQSVSGSILRANNSGSDFALLELSSTPPAAYNPYYSGWDRSGITPPAAVGIHHPSGDIKKISFENDPLGVVSWGGADCWHVMAWDDGTTEPGSSGSPLYDPQHRIIGQLYGGTASCSNNVDDYYGRLSTSWNGSNSSVRLSDWLDPQGTGALTLNGYPSFDRDLQLAGVLGIDDPLCDVGAVAPAVIVGNFGTQNLTSTTLTYALNGATPTVVPWNGNLAPLDTDTIPLPQLTLQPGANQFLVYTGGFNGQADQNTANDTALISFQTIANPVYVTLSLTLDDYGSETSWEVVNASNEVIYSGGPYSDNTTGQQLQYDLCLSDGCYDLIVYDSYGDGICCQYGNGGFVLDDASGTVYATGGSFGTSTTTNFCVSPCSSSQTITIQEDGSLLFSAQQLGLTNWQWYLNGVAIPGANQPSHTAIQNGNYYVEAIDANGCVATSAAYTYASAGLDGNVLGQWHLIPNPASDRVTLSWAGSVLTASVQAEVRDIAGRLVRTLVLAARESQTFEVTDWAPGVYTINVRMQDGTGLWVKRLVIE
jgi:lysyl endopeptidase